jgi:hypothetical protein
MQVDVGGFSKLPISIPTKGYIEDKYFLAKAEINKKFPKGQMA